jgi:hypothetical protein
LIYEICRTLKDAVLTRFNAVVQCLLGNKTRDVSVKMSELRAYVRHRELSNVNHKTVTFRKCKMKMSLTFFQKNSSICWKCSIFIMCIMYMYVCVCMYVCMYIYMHIRYNLLLLPRSNTSSTYCTTFTLNFCRNVP